MSGGSRGRPTKAIRAFSSSLASFSCYGSVAEAANCQESNLQTRRQGTYSLDTAVIRLIRSQQLWAISRVAPFSEASGFKLWALLGRSGRRIGGELELR